MKAIMISDHAKWCALMMNGKKNVEVRTSKALAKATQKLIDEYGFAEFYVYCSKSNTQYLVGSKNKVCEIITKSANTRFSPNIDKYTGNGKVLFKFRCYKVEEIVFEHDRFRKDFLFIEHKYILDKSCLSIDELGDYIGSRKKFYIIHISDLEIFDKPKELSEFRNWKRFDCYNADFDYTTTEYRQIRLTKAPQNFCYVEVER